MHPEVFQISQATALNVSLWIPVISKAATSGSKWANVKKIILIDVEVFLKEGRPLRTLDSSIIYV